MSLLDTFIISSMFCGMACFGVPSPIQGDASHGLELQEPDCIYLRYVSPVFRIRRLIADQDMRLNRIGSFLARFLNNTGLRDGCFQAEVAAPEVPLDSF